MPCPNCECDDCLLEYLLIDDESDDDLYEYEITRIDIKK